MRLLSILFLVSTISMNGAGIGVYNPAQHAVNGFMPTQLPGLRFWLDANRAHPVGTTNIDQWNDYSLWRDQYGTIGHAVQNVDISYRPQFKHGLNGRPACFFDGTNDYIGPQSYPTLPLNGVGFVLIAAVSTTTKTNSQCLIWQGYQSGLNPPWDFAAEPGSWGFVLNENDSRIYASGRMNPFFEGVTDGTGSNGVVKTFQYTQPVYLIYMNNTGGNKNAKLYSKGKLMDSFTLSSVYNQYVWIAGKSPAGGYFEGGVLETFVTGQGLTEAQLLQCERYIRTKYGITEQQ
jgi:hypothetical protein